MEYSDHVSETVLRLGLIITFLWLEKQTPFIRFIEEEELWMYRYPSVPSIISKFTLHILVLLLVAVMYSIEYWINKKKEDIIKGVYALTLIYGINGIFTTVLKLLVGRPRPSFFMRCFPDGYGTDINECTGEIKEIMDGRKSFPSGYTSFMFAMMFFISLHLFQFLKVKTSHRLKGCRLSLCCAPMLAAILIAASRTSDYHHHYSDVVAGSLIGLVVSSLTFYSYYAEGDTEEMASLKNKSQG
ncbi:phospholipid phosphatase 5 isoform X1 [Cylas formicarius]|uniref:phospholipid phosphatase 5 isoform X1 n=1 Tax=Cylas formicarius TaxID=197179 RepID=UPI0029585EE5|nr:phospholipid phosphatase 5 isoform X1 [Cylas formicarius]